MLIWGLFFLSVYCLIYMQHTANRQISKNVFLVLFLFVIIYFATFRDGLGMDYTAYKSYCERDVIRSSNLLLIEPFAAALESFCYHTKFSAVIFFFVTSTIICCLSIWVYKHFVNSYIAFFVFVTYTNLYMSSLNLVRQFVAASIVLFGTYYFIIQKKSPVFFLFVVIAILFHKSAVFLLFIYFLKKDDYSSILWTGILFSSWFLDVQPLFDVPIVKNLFVSMDYLSYINYNEMSYNKVSASNIYLHLVVLFFLWNKGKVLKLQNFQSCIFALKLTVIGVACANMSAETLPFAYRYAIFLSVFLPILFCFLPLLMNKQIARVVIYIPLIVLIWTVLLGHQNDRIYCPQRMLPIESMFDDYYNPYENPDVIVL